MPARLILAAAVGLTAFAATVTTASAWIADNGLVVRPIDRTTFEVPYRGKSGPRAFWSAAGDYVVRELGLSPNTRIYRISPPPRRSGQGMTFSLSPEGAQRTGLAIIGSPLGVRAGHARAISDRRLGFND